MRSRRTLASKHEPSGPRLRQLRPHPPIDERAVVADRKCADRRQTTRDDRRGAVRVTMLPFGTSGRRPRRARRRQPLPGSVGQPRLIPAPARTQCRDVGVAAPSTTMSLIMCERRRSDRLLAERAVSLTTEEPASMTDAMSSRHAIQPSRGSQRPCTRRAGLTRRVHRYHSATWMSENQSRRRATRGPSGKVSPSTMTSRVRPRSQACASGAVWISRHDLPVMIVVRWRGAARGDRRTTQRSGLERDQ